MSEHQFLWTMGRNDAPRETSPQRRKHVSDVPNTRNPIEASSRSPCKANSMKKRKRGMSGCGETLNRPVRHREPLLNSAQLRELSEVSHVLLPRDWFPPHPMLNGNHVACKPNSTDRAEIRSRGKAGRQRAGRFADGLLENA